MSFVIAAPEMVSVAAEDLADIRSALGDAAAAAATPTTGVAAAAGDEVSTAISVLFGTYGREFQALSAQAAAFHDEFVSLLNGGAAAYLGTEIANAEQTLLGHAFGGGAAAVSQASGPASLLGPILGGSGGGILGPILGGGSGGGGLLGPILGGTGGGIFGSTLNGIAKDFGGLLSTLLSGSEASLLANPLVPVGQFVSGLFTDVPLLQGLQVLQTGMSQATITASAAGNPWQLLFTQTGANLQSLFGTFGADPFPLLHQVIINQNHFAQEFWSGIAFELQNWPTTLANVPTNIDLEIHNFATYNWGGLAGRLIDQQVGYWNTFFTSLGKAGTDLQGAFPTFQQDIGLSGQALMTGNYHGAVEDLSHGMLGLFLTGFDTSNLSDVKLLGAAGDLLPILSIPAQQAQDIAALLPAGSIPQQMAQNFTNLLVTIVNGNTSATFSTPGITNPNAPILAANAIFGFPLSLGFAFIGPLSASLDGLGMGAVMFGSALQAGNGVAALGALADMPAYALNGFLNGSTYVDLTLPVATTNALGALNPLGPLGPILDPVLLPIITPILGPILAPLGLSTIPIVVHLPFDGLLVPPQQITATVEPSVLGTTVPIDLTLGGTPFGGIVPLLMNTLPEELAAAITPK